MANQNRSLLIGLVVVALVLVALVLAIILANGSWATSGVVGTTSIYSLNDEEECRDISVPYTVSETYTESVPYVENVCTPDLWYDGWFDDMEWRYYSYNDGHYRMECNERGDKCTGAYVTRRDYDDWDRGRIKVIVNNPKEGQPYSYHSRYVEYKPKRQVCQDVTRWKDVVKTRTTLKYRTETRCD